jgi:hypothetical protein
MILDRTMIDTTAGPTMQEDIVKKLAVKLRSVTFSNDIKVIDIPPLTAALIAALFYDKDAISLMKDQALMENAGVFESVSSEGADMFECDVAGPCFRRKSLERVSSREYSPTRNASPRRLLPPRMEAGSVLGTEPPKDLEIPETLRPPMERPKRETRGNVLRSRSGTLGPMRTDSRGGRGGRAPPRRARSSMAAIGGGGNKPSTLQAMKQAAMDAKEST